MPFRFEGSPKPPILATRNPDGALGAQPRLIGLAHVFYWPLPLAHPRDSVVSADGCSLPTPPDTGTTTTVFRPVSHVPSRTSDDCEPTEDVVDHEPTFFLFTSSVKALSLQAANPTDQSVESVIDHAAGSRPAFSFNTNATAAWTSAALLDSMCWFREHARRQLEKRGATSWHRDAGPIDDDGEVSGPCAAYELPVYALLKRRARRDFSRQLTFTYMEALAQTPSRKLRKGHCIRARFHMTRNVVCSFAKHHPPSAAAAGRLLCFGF